MITFAAEQFRHRAGSQTKKFFIMKKYIAIICAALIAASALAASPAQSEIDVYTGTVAQAVLVQSGEASFAPVALTALFTPEHGAKGRVFVSYSIADGEIRCFAGSYVRRGDVFIFHALTVTMPSGDRLVFSTAELGDDGRLEIATAEGDTLYLNRH